MGTILGYKNAKIKILKIFENFGRRRKIFDENSIFFVLFDECVNTHAWHRKLSSQCSTYVGGLPCGAGGCFRRAVLHRKIDLFRPKSGVPEIYDFSRFRDECGNVHVGRRDLSPQCSAYVGGLPCGTGACFRRAVVHRKFDDFRRNSGCWKGPKSMIFRTSQTSAQTHTYSAGNFLRSALRM